MSVLRRPRPFNDHAIESHTATEGAALPHGHACALWLPTTWRLAAGHDARVDGLLSGLFDGGGPAALAAWLRDCGVDPRPEAVGIVDAPVRIETALRSTRGSNFIAAPAQGG